jgi:hypothetical protein
MTGDEQSTRTSLPDWKELAANLGDQWEEYLRDSDDLMTIVVKGHLLIEHRVFTLVDKLLPNPVPLNGFRLIQRIRLLRALLSEEIGSGICDAVERLNALRNTLAHNLESPKLQQQIDAFLSSTEQMGSTDDATLPIPQRLGTGMAYLIGRLAGIEHSIAGSMLVHFVHRGK